MDTQACSHLWKPNGLWDGKMLDGTPSGGQLYQCEKCGLKATSMKEIKEKGGEIIEGLNVFGKPTK